MNAPRFLLFASLLAMAAGCRERQPDDPPAPPDPEVAAQPDTAVAICTPGALRPLRFA